MSLLVVIILQTEVPQFQNPYLSMEWMHHYLVLLC